MHEDLTMDAPLWGDAGGHTGTAPTNLHHILPRNPPKQHQPPLPISTKPRGVSLPHRGCTFDSAGLASVTQPTLGNDARDEATPLGGCTFSTTLLFYVLPHNTLGGGNASRTPAPILKIKKCVYRYSFGVTVASP